jgi:inorganic pyrophosphatase
LILFKVFLHGKEKMQNNFWQHLDQLVSTSQVVIDRPQGSHHPRYPELVYPYDYGYLENSRSMDGGGIDVWAGSLTGAGITAVICTVDLTKRDSEIKLLLGCTSQEAQEILRFHNDGSQAGLLIERP